MKHTTRETNSKLHHTATVMKLHLHGGAKRPYERVELNRFFECFLR